jgi:membrane protein implicated in regulation of membrane protease activity
MTWESFYLVTFLIGFLLSAAAFLGGLGHFPHFHFHGHGHFTPVKGVAKGGGRGGISPFNFGTAAAFMAWFGGAGYLMERYSTLLGSIVVVLSSLSGLVGAAFVFWFLTKLMRKDENLDPADYDMIGVLGRVAASIRAGGTGEMIFSRAGSRCCSPVRSENGEPIPRDTEVVVTRYEKGIAYVRRWDEMSGEPVGKES